MTRKDQDSREPTSNPSADRANSPTASRRRLVQLLIVVGLFVSIPLSASWFRSYVLPAREKKAEPAAPGKSVQVPLFRDWPTDRRPAVVLLLSGQEHGYLQPCGCSRPQLGGLDRRFNFLQTLRQRGWPIVAVDVGDVPQRTGPQALLKYRVSMTALQQMDYSAVGVGQHEIGMPLLDALAEFALNKKTPRVLAANLAEKGNFPGIESWAVAGGTDGMLKVGIVGVVGPSVAKMVQDPMVKFEANTDILPQMLAKLKEEKPEFLVLLYQGSSLEAQECARQYPQFQVILCLTQEEEPPNKPLKEKNTLIIGVGHKGRYVGTLGVFRSNKPDKPFEMRYELVALGENFETPADKTTPIVDLMEEYAREVREQDYLSKYPQRAHPEFADYSQSTYVGSTRCKKCHEKSYEIWEQTPHAHAYDTLVKVPRPSLRQFDGECIVCHTVGFGYKGGFKDEKQTPLLKHVGCESCHGPCSLHVKNPHDAALRSLINPLKARVKTVMKDGEKVEEKENKKAQLLRINDFCRKCHDLDNDVHWDVDAKWPKVEHHE